MSVARKRMAVGSVAVDEVVQQHARSLAGAIDYAISTGCVECGAPGIFIEFTAGMMETSTQLDTDGKRELRVGLFERMRVVCEVHA